VDPEAPGEIAKATGELAKLGTKALEFFEKLVGAPAEQLGGLVADELAFLRAKRHLTMARVLEMARWQLEERGHEPRVVPPRTLVPLLRSSSLEDDDDLIERWADLLANAADPAATVLPPHFVHLLAELSPLEVKILDTNYWAKGQAPRVNQQIVFPPDLDLPPDTVTVIKEHFLRLGTARERLVVERSRWDNPSDVRPSTDTYMTVTGVEFLLACHAPVDQGPEPSRDVNDEEGTITER